MSIRLYKCRVFPTDELEVDIFQQQDGEKIASFMIGEREVELSEFDALRLFKHLADECGFRTTPRNEAIPLADVLKKSEEME